MQKPIIIPGEYYTHAMMVEISWWQNNYSLLNAQGQNILVCEYCCEITCWFRLFTGQQIIPFYFDCLGRQLLKLCDSSFIMYVTLFNYFNPNLCVWFISVWVVLCIKVVLLALIYSTKSTYVKRF